jgi:hypothetical protein
MNQRRSSTLAALCMGVLLQPTLNIHLMNAAGAQPTASPSPSVLRLPNALWGGATYFVDPIVDANKRIATANLSPEGGELGLPPPTESRSA